jgi:hypothetical protein
LFDYFYCISKSGKNAVVNILTGHYNQLSTLKETIMKSFRIIVVIALAFALALAVGGCGKKDGDSKSKSASSTPSMPSINMQEGQWEMTTVANIPGMPAGMNKPFTITTCLTKNDLVPKPKEQHQTACKEQDRTISGNTISQTIVCPDSVMKMSFTYSGSTFEGSSQSTIKDKGGKEIVMNASMKGKYLGPCPAGQTQPQMKK